MVKDCTILLVDDDDDDILLFKDVITKEINPNISILTGYDGHYCLALLQAIMPDIIFLDINMPLMDGKECFRKIKDHPLYRNIPVVIYSTSINANEVDYFKAQGASILKKSVSVDEFVSPLRSILSQHIGSC
jgi:CheY-like chemotaxis protein